MSAIRRSPLEVVKPQLRLAAISVESVSKLFGHDEQRVTALDNIDLAIGAGEFVAIVGPSGCGKSTLLRIIAGILPTTTGAVTVNDIPVTGPVTGLGIVFQNPVLLEWRTILDNVLIQIELRSLGRASYLDRARQLLAAVGLSEFVDRYPAQLSGGMRQRAAIVRALIHDPPLLLMDEPFGALDALTREQMRIDLEGLWLRTRKTVLFVTHSIDEAVLLADRVIVMSPRPGQIEQTIEIGLPRPRGLDARKLPAFLQATESITNLFLSRGVLHRPNALTIP